MWPIGRQSVARHLTWGLHSKSSRTAHCTLLPIGMLSFSRHGALAINAQTFQATIGIFNQIPRVRPSNPKIPRIIHHIWLGSALPKAFQRSICLYAAWMSECRVDEWMPNGWVNAKWMSECVFSTNLPRRFRAQWIAQHPTWEFRYKNTQKIFIVILETYN